MELTILLIRLVVGVVASLLSLYHIWKLNKDKDAAYHGCSAIFAYLIATNMMENN